MTTPPGIPEGCLCRHTRQPDGTWLRDAEASFCPVHFHNCPTCRGSGRIRISELLATEADEAKAAALAAWAEDHWRGRDRFEERWAAESGMTVEELHALPRRAVPCVCDWDDCERWKMMSREETRIWDAWNALPDDEPRPVKTIAAALGLEPVLVATVVYPPGSGKFGQWSDGDEPDGS